MATKKISELTAATAVAGTDLLEVSEVASPWTSKSITAAQMRTYVQAQGLVSSTTSQTNAGSSTAVDLTTVSGVTFFNGISLMASITSGTPTYDLEVSGDNSRWNKLDGMTGLTANVNTNLAFPVMYVRVTVTGTGVVALAVVTAN